MTSLFHLGQNEASAADLHLSKNAGAEPQFRHYQTVFETGDFDMAYVRKRLPAFGPRISALAALAGMFVSALNPAYAAELIWAGDFEEGAPSIDGTSDADFEKHLYGEGTQAAADVRKSDGMSICSQPREGVFAGRARILEGGSGLRVRAELMGNMPGRVQFDWDGPEYWIGISLCVADYPAGSDVHTFLQVHAPNEPKDSNCDYAGDAISIAPSKDSGQIRVIDNPSGVSAGTGAFSNTKVVYSYNIRNTIGQWQDFVFRFRLSTKGDGYYTVWHNGTKVASETGLYNVNWKDSCGALIAKRYSNGPHAGIYGGPNEAGPKTLYLDAVRVAQGLDGYALVAPRGSQDSRPNPPSELSVSQVN